MPAAVPGIQARIEGSQIVFQTYSDGGWFEADKPVDRHIDRFTVFSREGAMWVIDRDFACAPHGHSSFPLTYGRIPECFTERFPAKPLVNGTLYRVEATDAWDGQGMFRMGPTIEPADSKAWNEAWPAATHPRQTYPAHPPPPIDAANDTAPDNAQ